MFNNVKITTSYSRNSIRAFLAVFGFLAVTFLSTGKSYAEGSGTWGVTANRQVNLFVSSTASNGEGSSQGNTGYNYRGFMLLASNIGTTANPYNPEHRLLLFA